MASPPMLPPSNDLGHRFVTITSPCEHIERYRPGGYHPVHLDDILNDGQYKIIRKLGEGAFSTVWLSRDLKNNTYVALKILVSAISDPAPEVQLLHHITQSKPAEAAQYVTQLLGEFKHHGPNGVHTCLVFEAMGPSVNVMLDELPQFKLKQRKFGVTPRYPFWMAKSILKQSLRALAFLHDRGIAHGDFQPGNTLFCVDDIKNEPEEVLRQQMDVQFEAISPPAQRLDGKEDIWAPRYMCIAQSLADFTNYYSKGFGIKLSDLGGAYFFTNPPVRPVTPRGLRAPELVLTGTVEKSLDVWAFGCLVFELITGRPLFCVPGGDFADDDLILCFCAQLGPLPRDLFKHWKNSSLYFTADGTLFNYQLGGVPEGEEPLMEEQPSMEEMFDRATTGLDENQACSVKVLLRRILRYNPNERPSPREILDDPFFSSD